MSVKIMIRSESKVDDTNKMVIISGTKDIRTNTKNFWGLGFPWIRQPYDIISGAGKTRTSTQYQTR